MAAGDITVATTIIGTLTDGRAIGGFPAADPAQKVFTGIVDVFERTITAPTSLQTLLTIGTVAGATLATLNHLTIFNEDATNFVTLGLLAANGAAYVKIKPLQVFSMSQSQLEAFSAATAFSAYETLATINVLADTGACKLKVCAF